MRITMKEIAKMANVSVTTVSKVLNHRDMNISETTKEKILRIAAEYDYVPNIMAKGLKGDHTNTLGIILPDITNPFFSTIARGIEDVGQAAGFGVVFCDTDNHPDRERSSLVYLTSRMIDGIIFIQTMCSPHIEYFPRDIPVVVIDRLPNFDNAKNIPIGKVYTDTIGAIHAMTFLQIESGCSNLAFISAKSNSPSDRYYGFAQALSEKGIKLRKELVYWGDFNTATGFNGVEYLIKNHFHFDGIVCGNDLIAIGAIDALRKHNFHIPAQVKVTGLDDIMIAQYMTPPLTTAKQFAYEMGEAAARMLIENILHQTPLDEIKFDFEIMHRHTV